MNRRFVPLHASAGFPSPAEGWQERELDLRNLLTPHPDFTDFIRVKGTSMVPSIQNGDYLVVDHALEMVNGAIIIAVVNGSHLVKQVHLTKNGITLSSFNPHYPPLQGTNLPDFDFWGVVTWGLTPLYPPSLLIPLGAKK